jgi:hypothetical protein
VQDVGGNPVGAGGLSITATIASGGGTLTGNPATTGSNGRATFSGLKITGGIGVRTLGFSSGSLQPVTSASINLLAGTATRIVIVTQPPATSVVGHVRTRGRPRRRERQQRGFVRGGDHRVPDRFTLGTLKPPAA